MCHCISTAGGRACAALLVGPAQAMHIYLCSDLRYVHWAHASVYISGVGSLFPCMLHTLCTRQTAAAQQQSAEQHCPDFSSACCCLHRLLSALWCCCSAPLGFLAADIVTRPLVHSLWTGVGCCRCFVFSSSICAGVFLQLSFQKHAKAWPMAWRLCIGRGYLCMPSLHVTLHGVPRRTLQLLTHTFMLKG